MSIDRSIPTFRARRLLLLCAALLIIVAGVATVVAVRWRRSVLPPPLPLKLSLASPHELALTSHGPYTFGLSLAPDGRRLALSASKDGISQLWLRDLTRDDLQPLPGTADAVLPFWSPDGTSIGFFAAGRMRVFVFADRTVRDLTDAPSPRGASWHSTGDIVFAPTGDGPLARRRPDGTIEAFTALEPGVEHSHRYPRLSPDGTHVLFYVRASQPTRNGIWIAPYDRPAARKRLIKSDAEGLVIGEALVYSSDGALVAQRVDFETRSLIGPSSLLGTAVGSDEHHALLATAGGDVLVFGLPSSPLRELRWFSRSGASDGVVGEPMAAQEVRLSRNGTAIAVARLDPPLTTLDIWAYEAVRPLPRRISPAIDADEMPVWSPDSDRLAWVTGRRAITLRDASGGAPDTTLAKFGSPIALSDWGGHWLVLSESKADGRTDIVLVAADGTGETRAYTQSPFNEISGSVSRDGRWLAYASDESGRFEVYVDAFPTPGRRARLTVGGGTEPRWAIGGNELFFRRGSEIHVVHLALGAGALQATSSERLFDAGGDIRSYDVMWDGQTFLVNLPLPDRRPTPMTVLVNVASLLPSAP